MLAAARVTEERPRVHSNEPAHKRPGVTQWREPGRPLRAHAGERGRRLRASERQVERAERRDGCEQERQVGERNPDRTHACDRDPDRRADAHRDEYGGIRKRQCQRHKSSQNPEPSRAVRIAEPFNRAREQRHRNEQVRGIRLHVRRVPDRVIRDRKDRHGQKQRHAPEYAPGHVPEQEHARDRTEQREEPERPLGEAQELHRRQLRPEEKEWANLAVVERPEQVEVAALEEVNADERLIPPERVVHRVPREPKDHAEHDERENPSLQPTVALG